MSEHDDILQSLEPLFRKAERECLWFRSPYQDLWFSPAELRANQANGRFIWGPENWELRDPIELVIQAARELQSAKTKFEAIMLRVQSANDRTMSQLGSLREERQYKVGV